MRLERAFIPYGTYYTTPFCRWQGDFAHEHALEFAANVTREFLKDRGLSATVFDGLFLGTTVPQKSSFYGAPWLAGMIGNPIITGPTFSQACATSVRVLSSAALEVEFGSKACVLGVLADRTSNGPHVYYPAPNAPGGRGISEDWVWDNFGRDPFAKNAMIETAERSAAEEKVSREEQDEVTLIRYEQYAEGLANDRTFQRKYMRPVTVGKKKDAKTIVTDEGVFPTSKAGLAGLRPVMEGGTATSGSQTHPADGHAVLAVCDKESAKRLSAKPDTTIQLVSFAEARAEVGRMPKAVVPAAAKALERAGITKDDVGAWKTHNPFAVNDVLLGRAFGLPHERINRFGSPLVYGHPQAPTGARAVIELVEELVLKGGGYGLFAGCAAGDTAMSLVVRVDCG
jgi:acetyl-CoA acetyltransferase